MTKRTKTAIALSALAVVGVVGGTYAYWNQTATIDNPFDTGKYGASVVENFKPEDGEDWQPGATIDKEVYVTNEGDYDVIARVKLDESWTYTNEETAYKEVKSTDDIYKQGEFDIYIDPAQAEENDGLTANDGTVVEKTFSDSTKWVDGGDGWYYYTENIIPGGNTDNWLTDVTLDADADMGVYYNTTYLSVDNGDTWIEYTYAGEVPGYYDADTKICYYSTEDKSEAAVAVTNNKSVITPNDDLKGYSDSDYVLSITVETVQATEDAVNAMFGAGTTEKGYANAWTYAE